MHASLLGTALESFVIDNDIIGAVLRTVRGIEVTDDSLSAEVIDEVVHGEGHFLGHEQTMDLMETGYTGTLVTRAPSGRHLIGPENGFETIWMAEDSSESSINPSLDNIVSWVKTLNPRHAILFDRFDYLLSKNGFSFTLSLVQYLTELAYRMDLIIIISGDLLAIEV